MDSQDLNNQMLCSGQEAVKGNSICRRQPIEDDEHLTYTDVHQTLGPMFANQHNFMFHRFTFIQKMRRDYQTFNSKC